MKTKRIEVPCAHCRGTILLVRIVYPWDKRKRHWAGMCIHCTQEAEDFDLREALFYWYKDMDGLRFPNVIVWDERRA